MQIKENSIKTKYGDGIYYSIEKDGVQWNSSIIITKFAGDKLDKLKEKAKKQVMNIPNENRRH